MLRKGSKKQAAQSSGGGAGAGAGGGSGMDDDVSSLGRGSRVWYRQDATTWRLAELRDAPSAAAAAADGGGGKKGAAAAAAPSFVASITLLDGADAGKPLDGVPASSLMPANPDVQATIPDLTQLSYLNEPAILGNLAARYSQGEPAIYTNAGPVLIALNPCKELPLYTEEVQHEYKSESVAVVAGDDGCAVVI